MSEIFDILVIGGGHAGLEAIWIASQFSLNCCLVTSPDSPIASAPCNPAIGGVGKGQVVREIDALGGLMGRLTDYAGIQYRTLNESKGYAVQSTRVQIDKEKYSSQAEKIISDVKNIKIIRELVSEVDLDTNSFKVTLSNGTFIFTRKIIVTTGTFLNGKLHTGEEQTPGGRVDCKKSKSIIEIFKNENFNGGRFKTGTPPRLFAEKIDFSKMERQESDHKTRNLSILSRPFDRNLEQHACFLTNTNSKTLETIRDNKERSPIFNGQIKGTGPRYCPSIEDKAFRYPEKDIHHVFIEPDSLNKQTVYPNGVSTSLPRDVQLEFIHSIAGLESAEIETYGYAVEYDVVNTTELDKTLQAKSVSGLYFAGQVCGTSGYEEAAGQGLVAGANASLALLGKQPLILDRNDSYIGVMVEDLVSNRRDEPYRLFTARSENRLYIREDNTILRMANYRKIFNLKLSIDNAIDEHLDQFALLMELVSQKMYYSKLETKKYFLEKNYGPLESNISLVELIKRPDLDPVEILNSELIEDGVLFNPDVVRTVAIASKYEGYINRSNVENEKLLKLSKKRLDLEKILNSKNISFECLLRIKQVMPETFGQLQKIDGIRPATLAYIAGNVL